MTRNPKNASLSERPLQHALKAKSRHRRKELAALAKAPAAPGLIRSDLVPKLALIECALADLVVPARNVRNLLLVVGLLARASWIIFATRCACLGPPSAAAASHNAQEQHGNRLDGRVMVQSFTRLGPQAHAGEVWLSIF